MRPCDAKKGGTRPRSHLRWDTTDVCAIERNERRGTPPAAQRGFVIVKTNRAHWHAIGKIGQSPLKIAPPFRALYEHYPVENLQEPLAEGIITGHPTMPEFRFDPGQVGNTIAYLKSLEH